tara:strand:- start:131 stop:454 length:324 start_codon:yes stop_codon:yes gene_type:complete
MGVIGCKYALSIFEKVSSTQLLRGVERWSLLSPLCSLLYAAAARSLSPGSGLRSLDLRPGLYTPLLCVHYTHTHSLRLSLGLKRKLLGGRDAAIRVEGRIEDLRGSI